MATQKRTGAKKSVARTTKKKTSARKKKSKVYVPANNILTLCAIIVGVCSVLLILSTLSSNQAKIPLEVPKISKESSAQKQEQKNTNATVQNQPQATSQNKPQTLAEKRPSSATTTAKNQQTAQTAPNTHGAAQATQSATQAAKSSKTTQNTVQTTKPAQPEPKTVAMSVPSTSSAKTSASAVATTGSTNSAAPQLTLPDFPFAQNNAALIIIFDDGGHNMEQLEKTLAVPFPVTVAVLPRLAHSQEAAHRVRQSGNEVILHQPMQAINLNVSPGAGAITPNMDEETVRRTLFANINEIAPITGMNNHEGSLITADAEKMSWVLKTASDAGLYFLDSRTNTQTKVPEVAQAMGYSYYERNIFLDNTKTRENILNELYKGTLIANRKGYAILIGHVWSAEILPAVLSEAYPELKRKGWKFQTVSQSNALITP